MARIYVASSWRNPYQPEVVTALRKAGHEVYDFRNPKDNPGGFHWADVDENWQEWQPEEYIRNLTHPVAEKGFKADLDAMLWADTCVLVLPCGRSAHTEAGWFAGKGLKTIVYMPKKSFRRIFCLMWKPLKSRKPLSIILPPMKSRVLHKAASTRK